MRGSVEDAAAAAANNASELRPEAGVMEAELVQAEGVQRAERVRMLEGEIEVAFEDNERREPEEPVAADSRGQDWGMSRFLVNWVTI